MIYLFSIPLAIAISLVYSASRHEAWSTIFRHAAKLCLTILGFMVVTTALLLVLHSQF